MKINKLYNQYAILTVALTILGGLAQAQTETQKKKDPFKRKNGAEEKAEIGDPERMLVIGLQLAEVPSAKVREWDEKGRSGTEWRNDVQTLIGEGKAKIVDSIAGTFRSGARGKIETALQLKYPVAMKKIGDSPADPEFPVDFDRRDLGIYFEADPVLNAKGDKVDLNFAFTWSRYLGEIPGARTTTERVQKEDVLHPMFSEQKIVTNVTMPVGEYQVLSRLEPNEKERRDEFDVVVFGRVDLVVVSPLADKALANSVDELRLRGTWVDVDADAWHQAIHQHSLSEWFGGHAWKAIKDLENQGKAKILASPVILCKSGQRSKVEVGTAMEYQELFPVPGEAVTDEKNTLKVKERILGHVFEVDPVLGIDGIVNLNLASTSTSQHGYSVSYRRQEGDDWVPSVQFPKFYESALTTQAVLGKDADSLIGVGTPPLENGAPDTSRKWVFFAHDDTFDTK